FDKANEKERNASLYGEIDKAYESAKKMAGSENFAAANRELERASNLARQFIASPLSGQATARNNFKAVETKWKQTISDFVRKVKDLKKKLTAAATAEEAAAAAQAGKRLDKLTRVFDAALFAEIATNLDAGDVASKRTAREAGLRHVRRYRKI